MVRLAPTIGEVRFRKKIQTENGFLGKTILGAFEAKSSEVFVQNNFAPKRAI
jgi:hypothetical protein